MNKINREKEFLRIQEKNDHYMLYVAVGGLYLLFFIYDKIITHFFIFLFTLSLTFFVISIVLFLISRYHSKNVAEEEARKEEDKDNNKIEKLNCLIVGIDNINFWLVIIGCISGLMFLVFNL